MQIIIDITLPNQINALERAVAAYNLTRPDAALTGEQFVQRLIDQHLATYMARYTKMTLTKFAFLDRFTQAERVAIREAAKTNGPLNDFMSMLDVSGEVQLDNPSTVAGVTFLETATLLAVGRAAVILAI